MFPSRRISQHICEVDHVWDSDTVSRLTHSDIEVARSSEEPPVMGISLQSISYFEWIQLDWYGSI